MVDTIQMSEDTISKGQSFLIVDGRKCVVLDETNAQKYVAQKHSFESLKGHEIMSLEYMNEEKRTQMAQYIFYKKNAVSCERLLDYIQHQFILLDCLDNEWYIELKKRINCGNVKALGFPNMPLHTSLNYRHYVFKVGEVSETERKRILDQNKMQCPMCLQTVDLYSCSVCKAVYYCSREHQCADWDKGYSEICRFLHDSQQK